VREETLQRLREGVQLEDGRTGPARVRKLAGDEIELTITEGKKRQVRRMCDAVGHPVRELRRVSFGPLALGDLAPGAARRLKASEIEELRTHASSRPKPPGAHRSRPAARGRRS
jgi:23S rRNA pseudouridine2605 synthase